MAEDDDRKAFRKSLLDSQALLQTKLDEALKEIKELRAENKVLREGAQQDPEEDL